MTDTTKTHRKIAALLERAALDTGPEAERAAELAARLMERCGISAADLDGTTREIAPQTFRCPQVTWRRLALLAVCKLTGTWPVFTRGSQAVQVWGTANAKVLTALFEEQLLRRIEEHVAARRLEGPLSRRETFAVRGSFASAFHERAVELVTRQWQANGESGLVVQSPAHQARAAATQHALEQGQALRTFAGSRRHDARAAQAGSNASLHRPMHSGRRRALLGS